MPSRGLPVNTTDRGCARSYARQALSDLRAREMLVDGKSEKCHRLHFLQMAAEKACKAHLIMANGHENVRRSHAYVAKALPVIARSVYSRSSARARTAMWDMSLKEIRNLAREVELLSPACDDGDARRDNSEYPWEDPQGVVCAPCDYSFPNIDDSSRGIVRLIKLIRTAAESYSH